MQRIVSDEAIAKAVAAALGARQVTIYGPRGKVRGALSPHDRARIVAEVGARLSAKPEDRSAKQQRVPREGLLDAA